MGKVGGWLAGIAAGIIVGYVVWYMTRPPQAPAVTTFEGMVYAGDAPVAKALVAVELTGSAGANGPVHDATDANGAYRIDFTGLPKDTSARLSVTAQSYRSAEAKTVASPLAPDIHVDFPLTSEKGGSGGKAMPPAAEGPARIPRYVRKSDAQATRVVIPKN